MLKVACRLDDGRLLFACPSCGVEHFLAKMPSEASVMSCSACSTRFQLERVISNVGEVPGNDRSSEPSSRPQQDWLVKIGGKTYPARDIAMLREWYKSGRIGRYTFLFSPGREWMCLRDVPELSSMFLTHSAAEGLRDEYNRLVVLASCAVTELISQGQEVVGLLAFERARIRIREIHDILEKYFLLIARHEDLLRENKSPHLARYGKQLLSTRASLRDRFPEAPREADDHVRDKLVAAGYVAHVARMFDLTQIETDYMFDVIEAFGGDIVLEQ